MWDGLLWEQALWELACKRKAGKAGRQDSRDAFCVAVRNGSGILPGAPRPFAGWARSHKTLALIGIADVAEALLAFLLFLEGGFDFGEHVAHIGGFAGVFEYAGE